MRKLLFVFVLSVFIVFSFGFIPYGNTDIYKNKSCPYIQQLKESSGQSSLKNDNSQKSKCPFLNGKKSECPFLNQGVEKRERGKCPYSSEQEFNKSNPEQKLRALDLKIS